MKKIVISITVGYLIGNGYIGRLTGTIYGRINRDLVQTRYKTTYSHPPRAYSVPPKLDTQVAVKEPDNAALVGLGLR